MDERPRLNPQQLQPVRCHKEADSLPVVLEGLTKAKEVNQIIICLYFHHRIELPVMCKSQCVRAVTLRGGVTTNFSKTKWAIYVHYKLKRSGHTRL